MLENKKKNFENPVADAELERVREWTKTPMSIARRTSPARR